MKKAFQFFFKRSLATSQSAQVPKHNASVYRIDDYGNRFPVKSGLTGEEAEKLADEYENKHHHQGYFVEYEETASEKKINPDSSAVSKKQ